MVQLFTPGLQVASNTRVIKRRELPLKGRILVSVGDIVASNTVVAEADLEGELRLVRVAETLGISPEEVMACMRVTQGESVTEGQVIAEMRGLWGLFKSTLEAPMSGVLEFISLTTGHVGIRAPKKSISLSAYIDGRIQAVEDSRAVIIEAQSTFVQGIFGVGGERTGEIFMLPGGPETELLTSHIPEHAPGKILVGGNSPSPAVLQKAVAAGAVGFVTGSIDDQALQAYLGYDIGVALTGDENISMTLIITEGFGKIAMNARILDVLSAVAGSKASINGATQVRAGALRPEIISRSSEIDAVDGVSVGNGNGLAPGSPVRLIRVPFFGLRGVVKELPSELTQIETGAFARVARVILEQDGREVLVPRANLEASPK